MNEIAFSSNVNRLQKAYSPVPRVSIHTALADPSHYLGQMEDDKKSDIATVYKLYLESGLMINLFDWFTGFCSEVVVTSSESISEEEQKILL